MIQRCIAIKRVRRAEDRLDRAIDASRRQLNEGAENQSSTVKYGAPRQGKPELEEARIEFNWELGAAGRHRRLSSFARGGQTAQKQPEYITRTLQNQLFI